MAPKQSKPVVPKAKAAPKGKAKAEKPEKRKAEGEAAADNFAAELAKSQANFVTQAKKENASADLKAAYEIYQSLPLRSEEKRLIVEAFKTKKDQNWANEFVEKHTTKKTENNSALSGWTTSYIIARETNIPHDSLEFQKLLEGLEQESFEKWDDTNKLEASYKALKLPRRFFVCYVLFLRL